MCNSSVIPLQKFGFNIIFIDIDSLDLLINKVIQIFERNKAIKALLVVHYFGFTRTLIN